MIITYTDKVTKLPIEINTDELEMIQMDEETLRCHFYVPNYISSIWSLLSTIIIPFIKNDLQEFVYICTASYGHYLINVNKITDMKIQLGMTTLKFESGRINTWSNKSVYSIIERRQNEIAEGGKIYSSSASNS